MKKTSLENRMNLTRIKSKIPDDKILMGSTKGKYPVVLDDGKTIIYISDESKIEETKLKYRLMKESRYPYNSGKYHS